MLPMFRSWFGFRSFTEGALRSLEGNGSTGCERWGNGPENPQGECPKNKGEGILPFSWTRQEENDRCQDSAFSLRRLRKKTPDLGLGKRDHHAGREERRNIELGGVDPGINNEGNRGGKGQFHGLRDLFRKPDGFPLPSEGA